MLHEKRNSRQFSLPSLDITKQDILPNRRHGLLAIEIRDLDKLQSIMKTKFEVQQQNQKRIRRADKLKGILGRYDIKRKQVFCLPYPLPELKPHIPLRFGKKNASINLLTDSPKAHNSPRQKIGKSLFMSPRNINEEYKELREKFSSIDNLIHNHLIKKIFLNGNGVNSAEITSDNIFVDRKSENLILKPVEEKTKFKKITYLDKIHLMNKLQNSEIVKN